MKTRVVIFGAIAALAVFAGACSAAMGNPKQTVIAVGYDEFSQGRNITKQVTISEGNDLVVNLASNPTTGFSWTQAAIGAPSILTQVDSRYVAPEAGVIGAAGTQVLSLRASGKGTTTVKMDYRRPGDAGGGWRSGPSR
jgi:predicted secreted protein